MNEGVPKIKMIDVIPETKFKILEGRREDIPAIHDVLEEFRQESLAEYGISLSPELIAKVVELCFEHSFFMYADDKPVGLIAGYLGINPLSGVPFFHEQVWYVSKPYRRYGIELLKKMEAKCLSEGIKTFILIHMGNLKPEKMRHLYEHLDYRFLEAHYVKSLS